MLLSNSELCCALADALCTLPVAALVKRIAASKRLSHVPSIDTVAPMVGMVVGWGAGDAFTQLLVELKAEYSATLCSEPLYDGAPPNCSSFNFAYAAALTLVSALAIALVQPLTKSIECGSSAVIDSLEDWLKSVWQLVSKGFATAVMIVWNTTLSEVVLAGTSAAPAVVTSHMLLFWSISITFLGALASVQCEQWEASLALQLQRADSEWKAVALKEEKAAKTIQKRRRAAAPTAPSAATAATAAATSATATSPAAPPAAAVVPAIDAQDEAIAEGERKMRMLGVTSLAQMHQLDAVGTTFRIHRLEASIELSNLIQGTLGWVAGSAWSDYLTWLYPSMSARSTTFVGFAANVGVAVLYGAIAILWLVSLGKDPNTPPWNEALAREDVEQYFLTCAAADPPHRPSRLSLSLSLPSHLPSRPYRAPSRRLHTPSTLASAGGRCRSSSAGPGSLSCEPSMCPSARRSGWASPGHMPS